MEKCVSIYPPLLTIVHVSLIENIDGTWLTPGKMCAHLQGCRKSGSIAYQLARLLCYLQTGGEPDTPGTLLQGKDAGLYLP